MIKYLDIEKENSIYLDEFKIRLDGLFKRGQFILSEETNKFEQEFAKYCETKFCVGVGNGLDALKLVLKAWGVGRGDEYSANVYLPWLAVTELGAKPIPVEPVLTLTISILKILGKK